jgi:DNA-binding NarL/FixJ family response regulator
MTEVAIDVLIVDDHRMFGETLAKMLSIEGMNVVGVATSGAEALEMLHSSAPRVVLVDHDLPDMDGATITREIKRRAPDVHVVMVTGSTDDRVMLAAVYAGCSGFITKDRAVLEVVSAVRSTAKGENIMSSGILAKLLPELGHARAAVGANLTVRELAILKLLAKGSTNRAIAVDLHLSVNTVRNYVQSILRKLGTHSKLEAVSTAVREGVIAYP